VLDSKAASAGNSITIGRTRPISRAGAAHEATNPAGARDAGAPGLHPHHRRNYYSAYVKDLISAESGIVCYKPRTRASKPRTSLTASVLSVWLIMNPAPPRRGLRLGTAHPAAIAGHCLVNRQFVHVLGPTRGQPFSPQL
jgi:hypothetical protein